MKSLKMTNWVAWPMSPSFSEWWWNSTMQNSTLASKGWSTFSVKTWPRRETATSEKEAFLVWLQPASAWARTRRNSSPSSFCQFWTAWPIPKFECATLPANRFTTLSKWRDPQLSRYFRKSFPLWAVWSPIRMRIARMAVNCWIACWK